MLHSAEQQGVRLILVVGSTDSAIGQGGAGTPATYMQWVSGSLNLTGQATGLTGCDLLRWACIVGAVGPCKRPCAASLCPNLEHATTTPLAGRPWRAGTTIMDFYTDPRARLLFKNFLCAIVHRCVAWGCRDDYRLQSFCRCNEMLSQCLNCFRFCCAGPSPVGLHIYGCIFPRTPAQSQLPKRRCLP